MTRYKLLLFHDGLKNNIYRVHYKEPRQWFWRSMVSVKYDSSIDWVREIDEWNTRDEAIAAIHEREAAVANSKTKAEQYKLKSIRKFIIEEEYKYEAK